MIFDKEHGINRTYLGNNRKNRRAKRETNPSLEIKNKLDTTADDFWSDFFELLL